MALEEVWTPRIPPASLLTEEGAETMLAGEFWGSTPPQVPWMGNPGVEAIWGGNWPQALKHLQSFESVSGFLVW